MKDVIVLDYDPEWPRVFEELRVRVWDAVSEIAMSIEHVGSTSVPGLAAKPVVDMDVVVPDAEVVPAVARLNTLGYEHRGDLGIAGREAFARPPDSPPHHLYLCPAGSPALANHLAIRDYMRANTFAARAYGDLKKRLAREHPTDIDAYIEGKTDFLVGVLQELGFATETLDEIQRLNVRSEEVSGSYD